MLGSDTLFFLCIVVRPKEINVILLFGYLGLFLVWLLLRRLGFLCRNCGGWFILQLNFSCSIDDERKL